MNTEVSISLGSNLGDRLHYLTRAKEALQSHSLIQNVISSAVYQTEPVDCPEDAPSFYNAVIKFMYQGEAEELLDYCQKIEQDFGRDLELKKKVVNAPRVIDLDILYYGQQQVMTERLVIPHQRMLERKFILEPLATISPDYILPNHKVSIRELSESLVSDEPELCIVSHEW